MKSTWFTNLARYDFGKLLQESSRNSCWETFSSFLTLASATLRQANHMLVTGRQSDAIEAEYMQAVKRVDKPQKLAEALSVLTDSLEKQQEDFLGLFMSEMSMNDKNYRGQCFTPSSVCKMMAKLAVHDLTSSKLDHRLLIQEPACGCGAMVIATAEELREHGLGPSDFYFVAVDIDSRCSTSAFIQFTLLDIPATVIHGNTLTLEQWSSWDTLRAVLTPFRRNTPQTSQSEKERGSVETERREVQLTLF